MIVEQRMEHIFRHVYLAHVIEQPISEFRIPNIYHEIFVLIFLMILRTHFEASLRFRKK